MHSFREWHRFFGSRLASGLGQGGLRLEWAKGRFGSKNHKKVKVLRIEFSIVEKLSRHQESIFSLFRSPNSIFCEKIRKLSNYIKFLPFPQFSHVGPMVVWGLGLLLLENLEAQPAVQSLGQVVRLYFSMT